MDNLKIITNPKNWMEHTAISQLKHIATYAGMTEVVGLPDLHAGRSPVGFAAISEGYIYPYLVGGDIGCGMGLFNTGIALRKCKPGKWETKLNHIKVLSDIPTENPFEDESPILDLGTIGGGNHFAEFQVLHEVFDPAEISHWNGSHEVLLLIHSGSRAYGQQILNLYHNETGYKADSEEATAYLRCHDHAVLWAERNREIVANKLIHWLGYGSDAEKLIDCKHNYIEKSDAGYIHRKGATSALNGLIVIPGSRGTLTYIVKPIGDASQSAYSLSHGAGRKWARSLCKSRINNKYTRDTIRQTALKSSVVCHDTELLFQEAPEAYKNITDIINVLLAYGLIQVVATLRPLITYKG